MDIVLLLITLISIFVILHAAWMLHRKLRSKSTAFFIGSILFSMVLLPIGAIFKNFMLPKWEAQAPDISYAYAYMFLDIIFPTVLWIVFVVSFWFSVKNIQHTHT